MRYLSMFSGIEAASVAWSKLGWECAGVCEIEPFPSAVLAHRFPSVPNLGDITKVDWAQWRGKVDLIVGGPPCQAFSVAGLRESMDDARGNLSEVYARAIQAIDPIWSLTENVPGWLSTKDNAFGCAIAALVGLDAPLVPTGKHKWSGAGVVSGPSRTAAWRILDAQFFGVPQRRRRVFVLSVRGSRNWACADAIFPVGESLRWDSAPRRKAREDVATTLAARTRGGGEFTEIAAGRWVPSDGTLLTAHESKNASTLVTHALTANGFDASGDGTGRGTPLVPVAFHPTQDPISGETCHRLSQGSAQGSASAAVMCFDGAQVTSAANRTRVEPGREMHTLARDNAARAHVALTGPIIPSGRFSFEAAEQFLDGHVREPALSVDLRGREGGATAELGGEQAGTLRASTGGGDKAHALTSIVRRLVPEECEALQGFPRGWTDVPYRGKPACDGPRYKAVGNSMAVPVMRWIGARIAEVEAL